jgi:hypothetical protein
MPPSGISTSTKPIRTTCNSERGLTRVILFSQLIIGLASISAVVQKTKPAQWPV